MQLFIGPNCPQCEALKKRVDLEQVPDLTVYQVPESGIPANDDDIDALAAADMHDVFSIPALVADGRTITDVFDILEVLQGAVTGGKAGADSAQEAGLSG